MSQLIRRKPSGYINFQQNRFQNKENIRDEERHYTMTKGSKYQEEKLFLNMNRPNSRVPKYARQK